MRDDVGDIAAFYGGSIEHEDVRLERHQLEYDLTWRFLSRYLPPAGSVLEIGAATGQYTLALRRRGYAVTAVDLSAPLLERCRRRLAAAQLQDQVQYVLADARHLDAVLTSTFDAVLLMGPLYHLVFEGDRREAVQQAAERLRPGGILVSAFLSRLGVLGDLLTQTPAWIERGAEVRSLLERGRRPDDLPRGGFRGYFARIAEIRPLHEAVGLQTLALAGVEPAISAAALDDSYNALQPPQRELWLDLLFEVSTDETTVGASRHVLYVGRKVDGGATV